MGERKWHIRLGAAAELDVANILEWTTENFGARQSRVYRNTIVNAIGELADGPWLAAIAQHQAHEHRSRIRCSTTNHK